MDFQFALWVFVLYFYLWLPVNDKELVLFVLVYLPSVPGRQLLDQTLEGLLRQLEISRHLLRQCCVVLRPSIQDPRQVLLPPAAGRQVPQGPAAHQELQVGPALGLLDPLPPQDLDRLQLGQVGDVSAAAEVAVEGVANANDADGAGEVFGQTPRVGLRKKKKGKNPLIFLDFKEKTLRAVPRPVRDLPADTS